MVNSKLRRHKVMERAIKAVMSGNLPPKFKYKDTYESIELPQGYTIPSQQDIEDKFEELLAEEESEPKTSILGDLEVGTANLYVDTMTSNVGIGTSTPGYTLDVHGNANVGTLTATTIAGDGSALSGIQSSNVSDFASNVTRIGNLETDLTSNANRIASVETDLTSNANRIASVESGEHTFTGIRTFENDIVFESNLRIQGDLLVANTINMTVSDPILELGSNNQNTGDIGLVMTRHGSSNSNVAVFFDESADVLKLGYTLNGANDSTLDLDSNALTVNIQGALTAASLSGDGSGLTSLDASNVSSGTLNKDRLPTTLNNTTIGSLAVGTNDVTLTAKADYHGLKILKEFDSPDEPATLLLAGDGDVFDDIAFEIRGNTIGSTVDTSTTRNSND